MERSEFRREINRVLLIAAGVLVVAAIAFATWNESRKADEFITESQAAAQRQADMIEETDQLLQRESR